ncbi:MAG: hypothetical protein JWQ66_2922 [Mucilaginibacter sp.]|nr:hypothetical protein [Mucilaginibacter sp.]
MQHLQEHHYISIEKKSEIINALKKVLYKEKPIAYKVGDTLTGTGGASATDYFYYRAKTSLGDIQFGVPTHEMGESFFKDEEPAQLLIRWFHLFYENGSKEPQLIG